MKNIEISNCGFLFLFIAIIKKKDNIEKEHKILFLDTKNWPYVQTHVIRRTY